MSVTEEKKGPYVFISYSSQRAAEANSVRKLLEGEGIPCWMAPKDIPAGSEYADVLVKALKECACLVLVLTREAQGSKWVAKEVERAINYNKPILTAQLEELELSGRFEFYIGDRQIVRVEKLDSEDEGFRKVIASIRAIMGKEAPDKPLDQKGQGQEKTPKKEADLPIGKDPVDGMDVVEGYLSLTVPALKKINESYELPKFCVELDDEGKESGPPVCGMFKWGKNIPGELYCIAEDGTETLWEQKRDVDPKKSKLKELHLVSEDKYQNRTLFKVRAFDDVALRIHQKFKKGDRVVVWGMAKSHGSTNYFYVRRILKVEKDK